MVTFDRPIMITCTGCSGSTVFYRILARHRDVVSSWIQAGSLNVTAAPDATNGNGEKFPTEEEGEPIVEFYARVNRAKHLQPAYQLA